MFPSQEESIAQLFMTPEVNNLPPRTLTSVIQIYMSEVFRGQQVAVCQDVASASTLGAIFNR